MSKRNRGSLKSTVDANMVKALGAFHEMMLAAAVERALADPERFGAAVPAIKEGRWRIDFAYTTCGGSATASVRAVDVATGEPIGDLWAYPLAK